MAASLNKVLLMGNLTRDPELRFIPSGQGVTTFTIAVNRSYMSQTGEKKEEVSYIRIVVWGKRAEVCNEYLKKGSPVFVEGRLQSRSWEAQDGSKRSTIEVQATNVQFLPRGGGKTSGDGFGDNDSGMYDNSGSGGGNSMPVSDQDLQPDDEIPF